jgi:DNA-binding beta-propeller fold protein YncE
MTTPAAAGRQAEPQAGEPSATVSGGSGVTRSARLVRVLTAQLLLVLAAGCTAQPTPSTGASSAASASSGVTQPPPVVARHVPRQFRHPLPGMPPVLENDVYAATRAGELAAQVLHHPHLVYVPDSSPYGDSVTVISQRTQQVLRTLPAGRLSQHVTPSYDLRHLYTNSSGSNEFVEIDPSTGRVARHIQVPRPYNLYFTPDGRQAVVMVEQQDLIRFSDPKTFHERLDVRVPACRGPNHADFSANGRFMVISCEFSGVLVKVGTISHRVLGVLHLGPKSMPQDVRLSPDGTTFYVADMGTDEVRLVSAFRFREVGRIRTPSNPHGLYPSRDGHELYVSDRGAGEVSVVSFRTNKIVDTWTIPGGGSPDMGGVSANGKVLWLSGRYDSEVYAFNTRTGRLIARIPVPGSPHGLCVWPQPGRYSLGHTGNMR